MTGLTDLITKFTQSMSASSSQERQQPKKSARRDVDQTSVHGSWTSSNRESNFADPHALTQWVPYSQHKIKPPGLVRQSPIYTPPQRHNQWTANGKEPAMIIGGWDEPTLKRDIVEKVTQLQTTFVFGIFGDVWTPGRRCRVANMHMHSWDELHRVSKAIREANINPPPHP